MREGFLIVLNLFLSLWDWEVESGKWEGLWMLGVGYRACVCACVIVSVVSMGVWVGKVGGDEDG